MYIKQIYLLIALAMTACNGHEPAATNNAQPHKAAQLIDSIAQRYGAAHFHRIDSLAFTFQVNHANGTFNRRWKWAPASGIVTQLTDTSAVEFKRGELADSSLIQLDARFVNDKYWLLFPLQMHWDSTFTTFDSAATAPISGQAMASLKLVYPPNSGYTPGDSYTVYFDSTYTIREWTFCPGNDCDNGRSYRWERLKQKGPLTFTTRFTNADRSTAIEIKGLEVYSNE